MMRKLGMAIMAAGVAVFGFFSATAYAQPYNTGGYGECGYGTSCTISVASSGRVSLDITPTLAGSCTIAPDTVTVRSNSATGYTLQLASASASTALRGTKGGSLPAASGSITAPAALAANTWGYRLEGGVFGTGGSSASNIAIPSTTFAGVTASTNRST